ncbi:MAG: sensor histidine kinase [Phycisphaerales bacterium]|nr:sensor histidine kinase [Phycisphaerales bacterium]
MKLAAPNITERERELGAIINAYNEVTERLKSSHDRLLRETRRLHDEIAEKNRELARKQRLAALGEMAAGVAHEIRNPLAGIQLYASLLMRDLEGDAKSLGLAERIDAGVRTLDGIVGDVLAFAGGAEPRRLMVELAPLLSECLDCVEPARRSRNATIHVDEATTDALLEVDGAQVKRALQNLLFNALDAAGEEGCVWVFATEANDGDALAIHIADNGAGVADELKDRIFNPFFTTKDSGTGLGLAITHRIAEAHGGGIRVIDRVGGGAEMVLTLPIASKQGSN